MWWGLLFAVGGVTVLRWNWLLGPVAALWTFAVAQYFLRLTAAPFLTKIEILKFAALGILLFLAVQGYETLEQWQGFIWFVLLLGFGVSVFGILQHFTFNGKLYWLRELRSAVSLGAYQSRHFSGLIELIVPVGPRSDLAACRRARPNASAGDSNSAPHWRPLSRGLSGRNCQFFPGSSRGCGSGLLKAPQR